MIYFQRYLWSMVNALLITTVLVYAMFLLIDSPQLELNKVKPYQHVSWVHIPDETVLVPKKVTVTKPEPVTVAPPVKRTSPTFKFESDQGIHLGEPVVKSGITTNNIILNSNQLTLIFAYPPVYPASKLQRNIEGYAQIGFSVNEAGEVIAPFVIDSHPKGAFEKASLKAIVKFRYKPKYIDQKPVVADGQSYVFSYKIE